MKSSTSPGAREGQEPGASEWLLEQHGDGEFCDRPSIAEVGDEGSSEDKGWTDLAASARAEWLTRNPF